MNRTRFSDLVNLSVLAEEKVLFVGVGSVGSNLVRAAASVGVENITMYDGDTVGHENIAVSWLSEPGEFKVNDIRNNLARLYEVDSVGFSYRARPHILSRGLQGGATVLVVSTDNIESRSMVYESFVMNGGDNTLYVDFRIGGYNGHVYSFLKSDKDAMSVYADTLDNEGTGIACGAKAYPGLTLGWCPMTFVDILARKSYGLPQIYHRSCYSNPKLSTPQHMFVEL